MKPIRIPNAEGIAAMTPRQRKSLETRLRNTAQRQGKLLVKSRRRDPFANDYGLYVLVADTPENHRIGAPEPIAAFNRGEGTTLNGIARVLFGFGQETPQEQGPDEALRNARGMHRKAQQFLGGVLNIHGHDQDIKRALVIEIAEETLTTLDAIKAAIEERGK